MDDVGYGRDWIEDFVSGILERDCVKELSVLLIFKGNGHKIGGAERWVVMIQQSTITKRRKFWSRSLFVFLTAFLPIVEYSQNLMVKKIAIITS